MPFFGQLRHGILKIDEQEFQIGQHGFFRDSEFEMYNAGKKVLAILKSNHETMAIYPYQFNFKATFEFIEKGIKMDFILKNTDTKSMQIAPGFHPYFAVKNRDEIFITTKADSGNDSLNNFADTKLEDTGVFNITTKNDGIKTLHIQSTPNIQLINHQLDNTSIFPGNGSEIILSADMQVFSRMTIWRPKSDVDYICVEPSFVENAINTGNGIKLQSGEEFKTSISIVMKQ